MKFKRVFLMVLDSLGVGEAIDADNYNDVGSNTLGHIQESCDLFIPNLKKLGFLNTITMSDLESDAYYTIAKPTNLGNDSLDGHYELMGINNEIPFKNFTENAFPRELLEEIARKTRRRVIGNIVGNGEEIIKHLGERQIEYNSLIIYTSNGSNLKVACHEDSIAVNELYDICQIIREITKKEEWKVGRVVAKPFSGKNSNFKFTKESKEFALDPPEKGLLETLYESKLNTICFGKIADCFNMKGVSKVVKTKSNVDCLNKLSDIMTKNFTGLAFINLSDFDTDYAHKGDIEGYAHAIEELDVEIPILLNKLNNDDLFIITADHGCDPSLGGRHTRENVPVILFSRSFKEPKRLPILETMADIAATIADNFEVELETKGTSFLEDLK